LLLVVVCDSVVGNAPPETDECNTLLFQRGQTLLQYIHGLGIGMTNTDGMTTALGNAHEFIKLTMYRGMFGHVIEKNIPFQCVYIVSPGSGSGHTFGAGDGIDKNQCFVSAHGFHNRRHGAIITGESTAHVVIHTDDMGYRLQIVGKGSGDFQIRHRSHQLAWTRVLVFQG